MGGMNSDGIRTEVGRYQRDAARFEGISLTMMN